MKVKDKVCVVTGAAGGIGEAIARRYAKEGAKGVVVADRDAGRLEAVAKDIKGIAVACDVAKEADIRHLIAEAERHYGPVDVFFSNAGIGRGGHEDALDKDWADSAGASTSWPMSMPRAPWCRACWQRKSGYLLNTASAAGLLASMGSAPYGVTKHAAVALAEHLSIQYGDKGICVSVLCPQAVDTNMLRMAGATAASVDGVLNTDAVAQTVIDVDGRRDLPDPAASRREGVHDAQDRRHRPLAARHAPPARQDGRGTGTARVSKSVDLWLDLKSPYSFLAKDPAYALERELGVTLRLRPYALDILGAYNVADPKVAERGLRRIKYLYADVRRFANQRGMIIRGPQKIFDSTLIHLAWMFADAGGKGRALIDAAYPRFFKRELDYEDRAAVEALLKEIGVDLAGFDAFATGAGPALLAQHQAEADKQGVFAVPTFVVDGELFWGQDRIDFVRAKLAPPG